MAYVATRFLETPIFTRSILVLLGDEAYGNLQVALLLRPEEESR